MSDLSTDEIKILLVFFKNLAKHWTKTTITSKTRTIHTKNRNGALSSLVTRKLIQIEEKPQLNGKMKISYAITPKGQKWTKRYLETI